MKCIINTNITNRIDRMIISKMKEKDQNYEITSIYEIKETWNNYKRLRNVIKFNNVGILSNGIVSDEFSKLFLYCILVLKIQ